MMTTLKNQRFFAFAALCLDFDFIRTRHTPKTYSCFYFRFFHLLTIVVCLAWHIHMLLRNFSLILCFLFLFVLPSISISFSLYFTFLCTWRLSKFFLRFYLISAVCVCYTHLHFTKKYNKIDWNEIFCKLPFIASFMHNMYEWDSLSRRHKFNFRFQYIRLQSLFLKQTCCCIIVLF